MSGHAGPLASGGYPCVRKAAVAIERFSLVDPLEMISPSHHRYSRIEVDIEAVTHQGGDLHFRFFVSADEHGLVHQAAIPGGVDIRIRDQSVQLFTSLHHLSLVPGV